ncbi:trehalose-6-phosphate synthase [Omnitrophica bacterium]|nr:trehalose-6-phosphate synthase [Candidatus Omnitrophota bacterium]
MWTKEDLQKLIGEKMGDYKFIIVSNRQPYAHFFRKGKIEYRRGVGGVITALDPIMQACNGTWIAYGSEEADHVITDKDGKVKVPPDNPTYTLKRVRLTKEEESGYYYGFSNEALWPLCHMAFHRPVFRKTDWELYAKVNKKFADAVLEEVGDDKAFVFVQDFHLTLLPKYLREEAGSRLIIAHFWHIPWPNYETFRICPQKHEVLEGMLANDLLGFHIRYHCDNFIDTIDREMESKIDRERFSVTRSDHETLIRPYPISVDFEGIDKLSSSQDQKGIMEYFKEEYDLYDKKVLLGIDRIDYTKGIPERLTAVDRFLDKYPEFKEKFVFLQMGQLTRIHIDEYKKLNDRINALVADINWKHLSDGWKPIIFVRRHSTLREILALYRLSDICIVSSLHDGMNLVAKEFISAKTDEDGVLMLSQFTGAARELGDAVLINPYDIEQFSEGIHEAFALSEDERKKRMAKMRQVARNSNIYRWAGKILSELLKFEFKE